MTLSDLITAVERAEGPSREIDAAVMETVGGARRVDEFTFYGPNETVWYFGDHEDEETVPPLPYVTASIDAVDALAQREFPGLLWTIRGPTSMTPAWRVIAQNPRQLHPYFEGKHPVEAMARLAAFLRAVRARQENDTP